MIDNFDDRDLEEIIHSKNALKNAENMKKNMQDNKETNDQVTTNSPSSKITMVDLETALSYMLRREVPRIKIIKDETYDALVHWLTVLSKVS